MKETTIELRPSTLKWLASMYGVDKRTMRKWLLPIKEELGERLGNFYNISQLKIIFSHIKLPSTIKIKEYQEEDFD